MSTDLISGFEPAYHAYLRRLEDKNWHGNPCLEPDAKFFFRPMPES